MNYRVFLTEEAEKLLVKIRDRREQELLLKRIEGLTENPEQQGKVLGGSLSEYRSIRAVGQRYRIIYRVENESVVVIVVAIGRRNDGSKKDVYKIAQKMVQDFQLQKFLEDQESEQ